MQLMALLRSRHFEHRHLIVRMQLVVDLRPVQDQANGGDERYSAR
jgi:hypothetical protein